jgi:hypothetical protein
MHGSGRRLDSHGKLPSFETANQNVLSLRWPVSRYFESGRHTLMPDPTAKFIDFQGWKWLNAWATNVPNTNGTQPSTPG